MDNFNQDRIFFLDAWKFEKKRKRKDSQWVKVVKKKKKKKPVVCFLSEETHKGFLDGVAFNLSLA